MRNQMWERIIYDYKKSSFPRKNEVVELLEGKFSSLDSLNFKSGTEQTVDSLLKLIEATRRMYEENATDGNKMDLWSIHIQSIIMLENVLLINSKKISS